MDIQKKENETSFEWELRLCLAKLNKEIDLDWQEIVDVLDLNIHYDSLRKMSYGYQKVSEYLKYNGVSTRILSISDTHVPFQLPISTFKDYVSCVDILQLNGDIQDCQSASKFSKKYRIDFVEEMIQTRQYIIDLITYIKPKKVIINKGNHEDRLLRMMSEKLNEDFLKLMPDSSLDLIVNNGFKNYDRKNKSETWYEPLTNVFNEIEIEYTNDWKCKIGKTWFIHPSAYSSSMLKTTEKAINYFYRTDTDFDTIVTAHVHKLGSYIQGNVYLFEQGCCCKSEEMNYMDGKLSYPQQQGFIYICQSEDGSLIYEKTKLINLK